MASDVITSDISRTVRTRRSIRLWAGFVVVTVVGIPAGVAAWRGVKWGVTTVMGVGVAALGAFAALLVSEVPDAHPLWRKVGILTIAAIIVWVGWRHVSVVLPYLWSGQRSILFPEYSPAGNAAGSGIWHNFKGAPLSKRIKALAWMVPALPAGVLCFLVLYQAVETIMRFVPESVAPWFETFDIRGLLNALISAAALGMIYILFRHGLRHITPTAAAIRNEDPRPPVLLLRSFKDEDTSIQRSFEAQILVGMFEKIPERLDELVEQRLHVFGPVIAIGRPKEALPSLGAAREYILDAGWQSLVEMRLHEAGLVVAILGDTEGFVWEMRAVLRLSIRQKLILIMPATLGRRQRAERWNKIAKALDVEFDLPGDALIVWWDNGHTHVVTGGLLYRDTGAYGVALERFPLDVVHYVYPACRK